MRQENSNRKIEYELLILDDNVENNAEETIEFANYVKLCYNNAIRVN